MPYCVQCGALRESDNPCGSCRDVRSLEHRSYALFLAILASACVLSILVWTHRSDGIWRFVGICFLPNMLMSLILLAKTLGDQALGVRRKVEFRLLFIGDLAQSVRRMASWIPFFLFSDGGTSLMSVAAK